MTAYKAQGSPSDPAVTPYSGKAAPVACSRCSRPARVKPLRQPFPEQVRLCMGCMRYLIMLSDADLLDALGCFIGEKDQKVS